MKYDEIKEFERRLIAEGCKANLDIFGYGEVRKEEQRVLVIYGTEIKFQPKNRRFANWVLNIHNEVTEYMVPFKSVPLTQLHHNNMNTQELRQLVKYNNIELDVRVSVAHGIDFVTWQINRYDARELGHYFTDYAAAKEDFAMRCGLIDRRKLFSETELRLIRASLADIGDITPDRGVTEQTAIYSLVERIDDILIPSLADEEQDAEDQGVEPEIDL